MDNNPDPKYKWRAMLTVSIGIFMATLDGSIVNIALPTLTRLFDTDIPTASWVILSYLLTITTFLLTLGRLSDMYGRKKVLQEAYWYSVSDQLFAVCPHQSGN